MLHRKVDFHVLRRLATGPRWIERNKFWNRKVMQSLCYVSVVVSVQNKLNFAPCSVVLHVHILESRYKYRNGTDVIDQFHLVVLEKGREDAKVQEDVQNLVSLDDFCEN